MDANQFDGLSLRFARLTTRRGVSRLVLSLLALAGVLAGAGPAAVSAVDDDHGSSHRHRRRITRHKHRKNIVRRNKKHKPRRKTRNGQSDDQGGDACVPITPAFTTPVVHCASDAQCCAGGTCCNLGDGGLGCIDLSSNRSYCGTTCENGINCGNFSPFRDCVGGECVEVP